jgi:hypothetical protein
MGYFPGLKRPGREADSSPSSAEGENAWSSIFTPQHVSLHGNWLAIGANLTLPKGQSCLRPPGLVFP